MTFYTNPTCGISKLHLAHKRTLIFCKQVEKSAAKHAGTIILESLTGLVLHQFRYPITNTKLSAISFTNKPLHLKVVKISWLDFLLDCHSNTLPSAYTTDTNLLTY